MEFNVQLQLAGLLEWMHQQMNACHGKTAVIGISGERTAPPWRRWRWRPTARKTSWAC